MNTGNQETVRKSAKGSPLISEEKRAQILVGKWKQEERKNERNR